MTSRFVHFAGDGHAYHDARLLYMGPALFALEKHVTLSDGNRNEEYSSIHPKSLLDNAVTAIQTNKDEGGPPGRDLRYMKDIAEQMQYPTLANASIINPPPVGNAPLAGLDRHRANRRAPPPIRPAQTF